MCSKTQQMKPARLLLEAKLPGLLHLIPRYHAGHLSNPRLTIFTNSISNFDVEILPLVLDYCIMALPIEMVPRTKMRRSSRYNAFLVLCPPIMEILICGYLVSPKSLSLSNPLVFIALSSTSSKVKFTRWMWVIEAFGNPRAYKFLRAI